MLINKQINKKSDQQINNNKDNLINNSINKESEQKLLSEIQNLKNQINQLNKDKKNLEEQLNIEKSKNKTLTEQNNIFKIYLHIKDNEIPKISKYVFDRNLNGENGEKIVAINFMPLDQSFSRPIACNNHDTLAMLEQKIYNEYPQFKEINTYLTVGGEIKKRFKTVDENKIKDGSAIVINTYDNI